MDLTKPLLHPIDTGLKTLGWSVGVVRGTLSAAAGAISSARQRPEVRQSSATAPSAPDTSAVTEPSRPSGPPRTQTPGDLPTPADLAERVTRTEDVTTPVGTTGAGAAYNPDTTESDLQQPGTEPLMDPSTTKAVASEATTLSRAADPDKG